MVKTDKKYGHKNIFFSQKFLSLIGLAIIILISFPFAKNTLKQYRLNKEIDDYKKQIASLKNKGKELRNFITYLESDQFAEEQARLKLNLKKPGEEVLVIKNSALAEDATSSIGSIFFDEGKRFLGRAELSNPGKWLDYFFR